MWAVCGIFQEVEGLRAPAIYLRMVIGHLIQNWINQYCISMAPQNMMPRSWDLEFNSRVDLAFNNRRSIWSLTHLSLGFLLSIVIRERETQLIDEHYLVQYSHVNQKYPDSNARAPISFIFWILLVKKLLFINFLETYREHRFFCSSCRSFRWI